MNVTDMNNRLFDVFMEWESTCDFFELAKTHNLSRPFVCSVTDKYVCAEKRIMIVGQEPFDWPLYDSAWPEDEIQEWGIRYLEKQIWDIGSEESNPSPFWKLFQFVEQSLGYCPCWNNVDKAHRIVNGHTSSLCYKIEKKMNGVLLHNGKTILKEEISIVEPDAVLFATGPNYTRSMALSLMISEEELNPYRPSRDRLCSDISEVARLGKPVIWTYHPGYLRRNKDKERLTNDFLRMKLEE